MINMQTKACQKNERNLLSADCHIFRLISTDDNYALIIGLGVGIPLSLLALLLLSICCAIFFVRRRKRRRHTSNESWER